MNSSHLGRLQLLGLMAVLVTGITANAQPVQLKVLYMGGDPPLDMQIKQINETQVLGGVQLQFVHGDSRSRQSPFVQAQEGRYDLYFRPGGIPADERARFMTLDPYLARDGFAHQNYQHVLDRFRSNGKLHELPVMLEPQVFFYHRDRLADAGFAPPKSDWTWQAFSQIALKLSGDAGRSHTYGAAAGSDLWPLMLLGSGDPAALDDQTYRQTLQVIRELRDSGALYSQYKPSPFELFRNGHVDMVLTTFTASSATDFADNGTRVRDLAVLPLPRLDSVRPALLSWADVLAIPTTSEHVDLAWRAARYLAGNEEARDLAAAGWIPANRDDSVKRVWLQAWHARLPGLQGLQSLLGTPSAVLISSAALDRWWSTMSRVSFYLLSGRISFEEALSQAMAAKAQLQIASAGSES